MKEQKYWVPFTATASDLEQSLKFDAAKLSKLSNSPKWSTSNRYYMEEICKTNFLTDQFHGFGLFEQLNKFIYVLKSSHMQADSWLKLGKCITINVSQK